MVRTCGTQRRARTIAGVILAAAVALAEAARGQAPPAPDTAAPTAIPVSAIAVQADAVRGELRAIERNVAEDAAVESVAASLPGIAAELDSLHAFLDKPRAVLAEEALDDVEIRTKAIKGALADGLVVLTRAAARLDDDLETLAGMRRVWESTSASLKGAAAPPVVAERLEVLLAEIGSLQSAVQGQRAHRLVVQDGLTRLGARADQILEQVAQRKAASMAQLFHRTQKPVWRARGELAALAELPAMVRSAVTRNAALLRDYALARAEAAWISAALYALLALLLWRTRRRIAQRTEAEPVPADVRTVVDHPFASAFVGNMVAIRLLYPDAPKTVMELVSLVAVVALIRLGRHLLDRRLLPSFYVLLALVSAQKLGDLIGIAPIQRSFLFLQLPLSVVLFAFLRRRLRRSAVPGDRGRLEMRGAERLLEGLLGACGLALCTTALGYVSFGRFLAERSLLVAAIAAAVLVAYRVIFGIVVIVLHARQLGGLATVRRHRRAIEQRLARLLSTTLVLFWIWRLLASFELDGIFFRGLGRLLGATFQYRAFAVSLGDLFAVALVIWASFRLSAFVRLVLEEDVFPRRWLEQGKAYALSSLLHYTVLTLGFLVAMAFLGFDLDRFAVLAGAFGVGIGFGMQAIINNFFSGLILLFERPLRLNDRVQIGDVAGEIKRIGFRSSTVRSFEGAELIVPNSILVSETVTNWTLSDRLRRIDVQVGVAYGTDVRKVLELLLAVARRNEHVIDDPEPASLFVGFGDSSLNFELRAWTDRVEDWFQIRSELNVGVSDALGAAGIEIPFPQRDVRLTSRTPVDVRVVDPGASGRP